jgi:hypothetical protein
VVSVEPLGSTTIVVADAAGVAIKAALPGQHTFGVGESLNLYISPARCILFDTDGRAHFADVGATVSRKETGSAVREVLSHAR